jgi:tetratricopeptide (TPR) repeat protein/tRNA A-37 threonylcarbamoyl transferase component Bud32
MTERDLFLAALEAGDAAGRAALLDSRCGGDSTLRKRVEDLLAAADRPGSFMSDPAADRLAVKSPSAGAVVAGRYGLLREVGEGGMGTVWLADQTHPVKRRVALKVIKAGMDSARVLARFEAERQALALMDHPNIARVLDAGTTEAGRPYFVMDLVEDGVPLTAYCDAHRLSVPDRLALFVQVCAAVHHAHQKGVIHRDLKPTNVLVEGRDGRPVPKVIDFGLAKATGGVRLTDDTLPTAFGTVAGTPRYMAPEQAALDAADVDTRADIYALGVVLFELLTGSTPIPREAQSNAALGELLRVVREVDPPPPSRRLGASDALPAVAANRQTEPARLVRLVRGELDWIVLKALAKDRDRRYESATALAQDVGRFLRHEPVSAGPPTAAYRVRKFVRRNRGQVVAAAVVLLALVGGTVGTAAGLVEAHRQERVAVAALAAEAEQRGAVEQERDAKGRAFAAEAAARRRADEEGAVARAVGDFLQNALLLQAAPEWNARAKKVTVEELLDRASGRIAGRFDQQPRVEAAIRTTIGRAYQSLGNYAAALPHLVRALELRRRAPGTEQPNRFDSANDLAVLYRAMGRPAAAEPLLAEALEGHRRVLGHEARDTLAAMNNLALLYLDRGRLSAAEPLAAEALAGYRRVLGDEARDTLRAVVTLASVYLEQGRHPEAELLFVKVLEVSRRALGEEDPDTLLAMNNLASLRKARRQFDEAEKLLLAAIDVGRRVLGEDHPDRLQWVHNLAAQYRRQGRLAEAEPLFVKALDGRRRALGEDHPDTAISVYSLGMLYRGRGRFAEAQPLLTEYLRSREKAEPEAWETFNLKAVVGANLLGQELYAEAEPLLLAGYAGMKQRAATMPTTARVRLPQTAARLVELYTAWGKPAEVAKWRAVRAGYPPDPAPPR